MFINLEQKVFVSISRPTKTVNFRTFFVLLYHIRHSTIREREQQGLRDLNMVRHFGFDSELTAFQQNIFCGFIIRNGYLLHYERHFAVVRK